MKTRRPISILLGSLFFVLGLQLAAATAASAETRMQATYDTSVEAPAVEVTSALDMRDDAYNSDYVFGMTKGIANSTMVPAVKPLFFLITIPLDIVFLPFAAIGGFF